MPVTPFKDETEKGSGSLLIFKLYFSRVVSATRYYPSSSEPQYNCHECEYSTSKRSNLMKHIISKQDENQAYPCDWCNFESAEIS